jgi:anti-anti-sigma factor
VDRRQVDDSDGRRVVALTGDLDVYTTPAMRETLRVIDGPAVIDLAGVRLITASALTELVLVAQRAGVGTVTLRGASPQVRRILRIAGFETLFAIE